MAEMDYKIVLGIVGAITAVWGLMAKMFWTSFSKHKETVQYKDNCAEVSGRIEQKIDSTKELLETKFENLDKGMSEIKELIKNNGNQRPRVQT